MLHTAIERRVGIMIFLETMNTWKLYKSEADCPPPC